MSPHSRKVIGMLGYVSSSLSELLMSKESWHRYPVQLVDVPLQPLVLAILVYHCTSYHSATRCARKMQGQVPDIS